jgi:hypothetical protein
MGFGGFSWKRAIGLSAAKSRLSRRIGIPLTKGGRERKLGNIVSGGGCLVALCLVATVPVVVGGGLVCVLRTWLGVEHRSPVDRKDAQPDLTLTTIAGRLNESSRKTSR